MIFLLILNIGLLIGAYMLGSIPTGYVAGRLLKGIDIRYEGSGSTGATNVLRTIGKGPALVVLLVDIFKGVGAIALVKWTYYLETTSILAPPPVLESWFPLIVIGAGLAAILGHSKSIWLNFTGGKSVATSLGVLFAMSWQVGLATLAVFAIVIAISRIVSLSSISAAISLPAIMLATHQPLPYLLFGIAGGMYIIWRHRSNIDRLLAGTEPRVGQKVPQKTEQSAS